MELILNFFLLIALLGLLTCLFFLHRNQKVYDVRIFILNNHYDLYDYLPSYDEMIYSTKSLDFNYWVNKCRQLKEYEKVLNK